MKLNTLLLSMTSLLPLTHAASRSSSSSTRSSTRSTTTTTTTTTASSTPTPSSLIFQISNFSAAAPYHDSMQYHADVVWKPNPNYSARCLAHNDVYTQCPNAPGVSPFNSTECLGPGGTLPDNGRWHWKLSKALLPSSSTAAAQQGFNFALSLGPVTDSKGVDHYYYGCLFVGLDKVKCDNKTRGGTKPAAYLDVPTTVNVVSQATSGCPGDTK